MGWFRKILGRNTSERFDGRKVIGDSEDFRSRHNRIRKAGTVGGKHFTDYVEQVKQLKRENRNEAAKDLLIKLVQATEDEAKETGGKWGVAPWDYQQLAIIYRKEKQYTDEVAVLERYQSQPKALSTGPIKLAKRLEK